MAELFTNCFEIDGYSKHEMSIFIYPKQPYQIFCSKEPQDVMAAGPLLAIDRDLWIVYLLRDPRDVVVSRHNLAPTLYWSNLRLWKRFHQAAQQIESPRFITVRYEDLVNTPDRVQQELMLKIPFLKKRANFTDFHKLASPSKQSLKALREVRPISNKSVGRWRQHKPRIKAQLALHGPIARDLIELGYEEDSNWLQELNDVIANNDRSHWPEHVATRRRLRARAKRWAKVLRYALQLGYRQFKRG